MLHDKENTVHSFLLSSGILGYIFTMILLNLIAQFPLRLFDSQIAKSLKTMLMITTSHPVYSLMMQEMKREYIGMSLQTKMINSI